MSDRCSTTGPPSWIDPLPDPETNDDDGAAEIESDDDALDVTPEGKHPGRRLST